jgi:hypothetical protein
MRINADMGKRDIEAAMIWLAGLIGVPLDRSVENVEQHGTSNPLLASYFQEKFALETALVKARRYSRNTGRLPFYPEYDLAYAFAVNAHRIHSALPDSAREPFSGRLKYAVNSLRGAQPFAFEIGMAVHLMTRAIRALIIDVARDSNMSDRPENVRRREHGLLADRRGPAAHKEPPA